MGFYRGPNIIRENLQLALDAINTKSYPGTGTTWTDLSGNSVTGTLTGATFDTDSIFFDGTDDRVPLTGTVNLGTTFSISAWVKSSTFAGNRNIYGLTANANDNWFGMSSGKVNFFGTETADTNNFSLYGSTTLSDTTIWHNIGCTVNGGGGSTVVKVYLDGEEDGTVTKTFTLGAWNITDGVTLGRRGNATQNYFHGYLASLYAYNVTLSEDDMYQNYIATKDRFK